jgi:hypothetical protein
LVVCQLKVTGWPEAMLLLLAEKTRVGAAPRELGELEPQPVKAMSGKIAASQNRMFERVANRATPLSRDDEGRRSWLLLRVLLPRLIAAACNAFLLKGGANKADIPATTVLILFPIPLRFPISAKLAQPSGSNQSYSDSKLVL